MAKRDYYEILGVSRSANQDEIKRAYRKIAKKYHPDANPGNKEAEEKFKEAAEAYEVLSDPEKRSRYDRFGHEGVKQDFGAGGFSWSDFTHFSDLEDILGDFFGGSLFETFFGGRERRGPRRGQDTRYDLEITLEEAYTGCEKRIEVQKRTRCKVCNGSGSAPGHGRSTCSSCGGTGQIRVSQGFFSIARTCSRCGGTGEVITHPCKACNGAGITRQTRRITVTIPPGVDTGSRLKISGEGEELPQGGLPGDLYVVIYVKEHEVFVRDGDNVLCEVEISYPLACLGGEVDVPTLQGRVKMNIPPGTQSHKVFRLRGKGLPNLRGYGRGDQLVRVVVRVPRHLSQRERELLRELASLQGTMVEEGGGIFKKFKDALGG
jgi:molecular chaperone DnaJ